MPLLAGNATIVWLRVNDLNIILIPAIIAIIMVMLLRVRWLSVNHVVLGCGLFLVPFVLAVLCCFPSMDDWCYADSGRRNWWSCQQAWYLGWSGRIGATMVLSSWGLIGSSWFAAVVVYRFVLFLIMAIMAAVIWDLSKALLRMSRTRSTARDQLLVTVAIAAAWISSMPDPTEGLYWLSGAATYSVGSCCGLLAFSCVLHARSESQTVSVWRWRIAVLAALLAPLFSEVVAVLMCTVLGMLVLITSGTNRWRILVPLLASVLGLAIVALAPGNILRSIEAARQGQVPGDHALFPLLVEGARLSFNFLSDSLLSASAALSLLVCTQVSEKTKSQSALVAVGILFATVVMIGAAALPMAWTGMSPLRAWNPVSLVVAIGLVTFALYDGSTKLVWVCLITIMCSSLVRQTWAIEEGLGVFLGVWMVAGLIVFAWRKDLAFEGIVAALAVGFLFGSVRFLGATRDVFGRGPTYVLAQQRRLDVLSSSAPGSAVRVNRLPGDMPYLYHHADIDIN